MNQLNDTPWLLRAIEKLESERSIYLNMSPERRDLVVENKRLAERLKKAENAESYFRNEIPELTKQINELNLICGQLREERALLVKGIQRQIYNFKLRFPIWKSNLESLLSSAARSDAAK